MEKYASLSPDLRSYCIVENLDLDQVQRELRQISPVIRLRDRYQSSVLETKKHNPNATIWDNLTFFLDEVVCGENMMPAIKFVELGGDFAEAQKIARHRINIGASTLARIGGIASTSWGVSDASPTKFIGAAGISVQVLSELMRVHSQNISGAEWRMLMEQKLKQIAPYEQIFRAQLKLAGFADEEIRNLPNIGSDVYSAELFDSNLVQFRNKVLPFAVATAMWGYGSYVLAGFTAFFGSLSNRYGEYSYRESNIKRNAQNIAGKSAQHWGYLRRISQEHISMTDRNNTLSKAEGIFISVLLTMEALTNIGNIFANANAIRYGFSGWEGTLTQQRNRASSARTQALGKKIIDFIGSKNFILTPERWSEHTDTDSPKMIEEMCIGSGVIIKDFETTLPDGKKTKLPPMDLCVAGREVAVIKATSGLGKSSLLAGLMHFSEHSGDIYIVNAGVGLNVHNLPSPEHIQDYLTYIAPEAISGSEQLVDIFNQLYISQGKYKIEFEDYEAMLWEVGTRMSDSLLKVELEKDEKDEKSVFSDSKQVANTLRSFRFNRLKWINDLLKNAGGNLAADNINGERVFSTLSTGEKQRVATMLALTKARLQDKTKAIILDEPLIGLDAEINLPLQLETISQMLELPIAPAIIIISHQHNDLLAERFDAKITSFE